MGGGGRGGEVYVQLVLYIVAGYLNMLNMIQGLEGQAMDASTILKTSNSSHNGQLYSYLGLGMNNCKIFIWAAKL